MKYNIIMYKPDLTDARVLIVSASTFVIINVIPFHNILPSNHKIYLQLYEI